jgi:hypothetical protein
MIQKGRGHLFFSSQSSDSPWNRFLVPIFEDDTLPSFYALKYPLFFGSTVFLWNIEVHLPRNFRLSSLSLWNRSVW